MKKMTLVSPCLFGVETYLKDELKNLNFDIVNTIDGRIFYEGDGETIAKANMFLRCAERVMILISEFKCLSFEDLFQGVKAIDWQDYINKDSAFIVTGATLSKALHSERSCQSIIKKAMVDKLMQAHKTKVLSEKGDPVFVQFFLKGDVAQIMIDTSGDTLHKRGYRAKGNLAPIRETLAAAMVYQSRYSGKSLFADPLCGSGTIALEAALIAKNRAAGTLRSFAFEKYTFIDKKHIRNMREMAKDVEKKEDFKILASDIDEHSLRIARENTYIAGVSDYIEFSNAAVADFACSEERGIIVTNPPYGERMNEREECESIYRDMGRSFQKLVNWKYYVITSHEEFEKHFGKKCDKKRKMYNGMIKCDMYQYFKTVAR